MCVLTRPSGTEAAYQRVSTYHPLHLRLAMESPGSSESLDDSSYVPYTPYEHTHGANAPDAQGPPPSHHPPHEGSRTFPDRSAID